MNQAIDLVALGQAVKFDKKNDYGVSGDLVLFTSAGDPDLEGQYFTAKTDFGKHETSPIYYHHALHPYVGKSVIGEVAISRKSGSIFVEGELNKRNKYVAEIMKLRDKLDASGKGSLGWSSGTASHLVEVKSIENDSGVKIAEEIILWPLGVDASLTPTPCEPRTAAKAFIGHAHPIKTWQISMKDLLPEQSTEFEMSEPLADPSKQPYAYDREPKLGAVMASKLATEYNRITSNLVSQYALGINDYLHLNDKFGSGLAKFHDSMDDGVRQRQIGNWDAADVHYKALGPHMGTVGDVYHAALTRAFNAGADHLLSRGHLNAAEHQEIGDLYRTHLLGQMAEIDETVKDRKLADCGSPYLNLKTISGDLGHGSQSVAEETEGALDALRLASARAQKLKSRFEAIRQTREASGQALGAKSLGHIDDMCSELSDTIASFKSLSPTDPDLDRLIRALDDCS